MSRAMNLKNSRNPATNRAWKTFRTTRELSGRSRV
jgi:hypothetical protein